MVPPKTSAYTKRYLGKAAMIGDSNRIEDDYLISRIHDKSKDAPRQRQLDQRTQLNQFREASARLLDKAKTLQSELEESEKNRTELQTLNDDLIREQDDITEKHKERISTLEEQHNSLIRDKDSEILKLKENLESTTTTALARMGSFETGYENIIRNIISDDHSHYAKLENYLNSEIAARDDRIATLQSQHESVIHDKENQIAQLKRERHQLNEAKLYDTTRHNNQVEELKERCRQSESERLGLEEKLKKFARENTKLVQQKTTKFQEIELLVSMSQDLSRRIKDAVTEEDIRKDNLELSINETVSQPPRKLEKPLTARQYPLPVPPSQSVRQKRARSSSSLRISRRHLHADKLIEISSGSSSERYIFQTYQRQTISARLRFIFISD